MIEGVGGFNPQTIQQARADQFNTVDTDSSGGISQDELQSSIDTNGFGAKLLENFDRIDLDGNGELDPSELKNVHHHSAHRHFNRVDQNDSGGLDTDEIQALIDKTGRGNGLLENFDTIDADGSGEISLDEIRAYKEIDTTV